MHLGHHGRSRSYSTTSRMRHKWVEMAALVTISPPCCNQTITTYLTTSTWSLITCAALNPLCHALTAVLFNVTVSVVVVPPSTNSSPHQCALADAASTV